MSKTLGQQLVIENVVGAGGTTGSTRAMRATHDGYTIIMGHMGTHAASVALYPNLAYHPLKNFETDRPCRRHAGADLARKDFPAKDLKEFVAYVKANADKMNMAHAGVGSVSFTSLPAAQLDPRREADRDPVPGHGPGAECAARRPGRLHVRPDRQRWCRRSTAAPSRPMASARRSVIPRCRMCRPPRKPACRNSRPRPGTRLFAPKGTPKEVIDKLSDALVQGARRRRRAQAPARSRQRHSGKDRRGQAALEKLVESEIDRWTPVIKASGITQ